MKKELVTFIPMDRRQAMARGESLPDRTNGSALFADISGFTNLTEALVRELGPQRGAEELTHMLNRVYDAVISRLYDFGGSVISFAGDAITCWMDGDNGHRAVSCALAMQEVLSQFAHVSTPGGETMAISIKVAVATGTARRFQVGDSEIRLLDALAGETLVRLAAAEGQALQGEVVVDQPTIEALGEMLVVSEKRLDSALKISVGLVDDLRHRSPASGWPDFEVESIPMDEIRRWLLPSVYARINSGLEEFLAELRPTVALFLRFGGIDFDGDENAGQKLDDYIHWVQHQAKQYHGTFIDLNIGDKGNYIYINFGAPVAHENNAEHAALAALALREPPPALSFIGLEQMGISQGRMRAGVYGGASHRTYGVLGDEVNLAARLMMRAEPGQILISEAARQSMTDIFVFQHLRPMRVKGKLEPVDVYALEKVAQGEGGLTVNYALPMVGRETELSAIEARLALTEQGEGQVITLTGDAGVGKSRLVGEALRLCQPERWTVLSGVCESHSVNSSYFVWQAIWRGLLAVDADLDTDVQIAEVTERITALDPALSPRVPLLGPLLQLPMADNDLTKALDAKRRKSSLHALLVDLIRVLTESNPTLLILENCHWLDPLSADLLADIAVAIVDRPVCLLLTTRQAESERLAPVVSLAYTSTLQLENLDPVAAQKLIASKLALLAGEEVPVSQALVHRLIDQSQGNPFYLEELSAYLYFQGLLRGDADDSIQPELPVSLHRLVLSRLDQLSESERITARVASVIGRVFQAAWLWGAYPSLGDPDQIRGDLEALRRQDFTTHEALESEPTYFFQQVITQNVAYESLPFAMRSAIHEQIGDFIEGAYGDKSGQTLDLLAFHYDHSENHAKRVYYLLEAGEAAQAQYANQSAIDYYRRVLPLLPGDERIDVQLKLGEVLELTGQWDEAKTLYQQALLETQQAGDSRGQAWCQMSMGELLHKRGNFDEAWKWLGRARDALKEQDDIAGAGQALHYMGTMAAQQGDYASAIDFYEESLRLRIELGEQRQVAYLLGNLGIIAYRQDDYPRARSLYEESLKIRRDLGDRWGIANSLNNLGTLSLNHGDLAVARLQLEEALSIHRELGDRWEIGNALNNLGNAVRAQGELHTAGRIYIESLQIYRQLGDKWALAYLLEDTGWLVGLKGDGATALILVTAASTLRDEINTPLTDNEARKLDEALTPALAEVSGEDQATAREKGKSLTLSRIIDQAINAIELSPENDRQPNSE